MKTFWFSFADPHKPVGSQFLGIVIVDGETPCDAHYKVCQLGLNPGGEVFMLDISRIDEKVKLNYKNRLLNKDEADNALIDEPVITIAQIKP